MNQLRQQSNKVYSVDFPALNAGVSPANVVVGTIDAPFYMGQSQILGIVCKTTPNANEGAVSICSMAGINAQGVPSASLKLASSNVADVGVYTLYWTNSTMTGGTLTAGGQPAQPA